MALSPEDRQEILKAIEEATNRCACGIPTESQKEMGHLFDRLTNLGQGNLNVGVETFSQAIRMVASFRRHGERAGGVVATFVLVTVIGGVGWLIGAGVITWIRKTLSGG